MAGHRRGTEITAHAGEYDSAKRTTFNAFYTSPTVITAIHEAIARLGVPANATILEPGCGTGNFMSHGQAGRTLHRRGDGFDLGADRQGAPPRARTSASRISATHACPRTASTRSSATCRSPTSSSTIKGQKLFPARLLLRQVDRRLEARRRAGAGDHAFHARQAERRHPRVSRLQGRFRGGHPAAVGCLQARRNRRGDRHRVPSQA